jgi:hypothetical protein
MRRYVRRNHQLLHVPAPPVVDNIETQAFADRCPPFLYEMKLEFPFGIVEYSFHLMTAHAGNCFNSLIQIHMGGHEGPQRVLRHRRRRRLQAVAGRRGCRSIVRQ